MICSVGARGGGEASRQQALLYLPCAESELLYEVAYPEFSYPGAFAIRRCTSCGLLFNSPRLSDADISALYDHDYYLFRLRDSLELQRICGLHQATVAQLEPLAKERKIVEIGSGKGYMLAVMRTRGWEVQGVELSAWAARYARRIFGIDSFVGPIEEYVSDPSTRPSPALIALDVIEHVTDLPWFVRGLNQALEPNGRLLVATPNAESDHIAALGARWIGFNPFHIWTLSRGTLTMLLEEHGFEVEEAFSYGNLGPVAQPGSSALRSALREAGLLPFARSIGRLIDQLRNHLGPGSHACLRGTVSRVDAAPSFFESDDGRSPRARDCRGDNLVVMARKCRDAK